MPTRGLVAGGLVCAAALIATAVRPGRRKARARLPHITAGPIGGAPATPPMVAIPGRTARPRRQGVGLPRWADPIRLGAAFGGLSTGLVVGGWAGGVLGIVVAVGLDRVLRRLEPATVRQRRLREAVDLPLAADLLAAALRAGAPVDRAVEAVAEALAGPLGDRLDQVGRTLHLGGDAAEAWGYLTPVPGGDRVSAAAVRSSSSGSALAAALNRLADDLRADRAARAEAAARRAGVLIVLPLGLCFLPAFILAGLVPVIVAVLGDVR